MLSRISCQSKTIANRNFGHKLFRWVSIDGCQKIGYLFSHSEISEYSLLSVSTVCITVKSSFECKGKTNKQPNKQTKKQKQKTNWQTKQTKRKQQQQQTKKQRRLKKETFGITASSQQVYSRFFDVDFSTFISTPYKNRFGNSKCRFFYMSVEIFLRFQRFFDVNSTSKLLGRLFPYSCLWLQ